MESENYKKIKKDTPLDIQIEVLEDITLKQQFYINKLEKQLILSGVSHSKNLTLLETIENTKQLPQVQYNLQRQLRELRVMSNKLGLYDAADFLTSYCS